MIPPPPILSRRAALLIGLWLLGLAGSCLLDGPLAQYLRDAGIAPVVRQHWAAHLAKAPGNYFFTLVLVLGLCAGRSLKWLEGGFVCLGGIMGLVNGLLKWGVGRHRPFRLPEALPHLAPFHLKPFHDGLRGLFVQSNLAFPSGHTCTAFATAAALAKLWPRWGMVFYAVAALVGLERIGENAHYLSDVVGGAGLSILGVHVLWHICLRRVNRPKQALPPVAAASEVDLDHD